jgi:hypothetical protein
MRGSTAERITTTMKNAEATNTTETAAVAEQGAPVAPEKAPSKKAASQKKSAPKAKQGAKKAGPKAKAAKKEAKPAAKKAAKTTESAGPREGTKTAQVIAMLQRKGGATLAEIMEKMGWQKHTVRGFMAGAMKKAGYTVESFKNVTDERTYRIAK